MPSPPPTNRTFTLTIGGHSRSVGKTSLVCDILRAFPSIPWTAVKITQFGHGVCSVNGESCACAADEHTVALTEEHDRSGHSDTSRFLLAGASRSFWLRTKQGRLASGLPLLRDALAQSTHAILESNSLLQFLRPDLYLVVLNPSQPDFKDSARQFLDRADAFLLRSPFAEDPAAPSAWPSIPPSLLASKPAFPQPLGAPLPNTLIDFLRAHLQQTFSNPSSATGHLSS